jgi:hypothetical protein
LKLAAELKVYQTCFFERLANPEVDDVVTFDGLALVFLAKRDDFLVIDPAQIEGAESRRELLFRLCANLFSPHPRRFQSLLSRLSW